MAEAKAKQWTVISMKNDWKKIRMGVAVSDQPRKMRILSGGARIGIRPYGLAAAE